MAKSNVAIVVDSTADLTPELIEQYNIRVIPLIINWSGESLYDGRDITADTFYQRLATATDMPTTSQPSAGEFVEVFQEAAQTADSILCLTISSELSGTYASAQAARDMMEDIPVEVVDSRQASMGLGFVALAAARALEEGASLSEAVDLIHRVIEQTQLMFVVDTLEFLHRGGRIGGGRRFIGSVLSIKPILGLDGAEGTVQPRGSVRTKKKAVKHMVSLARDHIAGRSNLHLAILSTGPESEAQQLGAQLQAEFNPVELHYANLSPVIGTHVGPGAIGFVYYTLD